MTAHKAYVVNKKKYSQLSFQLVEYAYDTADDGPEIEIIENFRIFPEGWRSLCDFNS
jgi:hypothetical protein